MFASRAFAIRKFSFAAFLAILSVAGVAPAQTEKPAPKRLDLNKATVAELETLPGVGPALAKKIVDGRPFESVEQLSKAGVSVAEIEKLRPLVEVPGAPAPKAAPGASKLDLNTASAAELEALPGIGPALAKAIIDARPYPNVEDLRRVKGLSASKINAIKDRVRVGNFSPRTSVGNPGGGPAGGSAKKAPLPPGTKININTATLAELDALPGIGEARAKAIIEARPFEKPEDIMKVKGIKQVEFSKIKDLIVVK